MPLSSIAAQMNQLQSGIASAERVFEVMDGIEQSVESDSGQTFTAIGKVELQEVNFKYVENQPLIHDFNLSVEPGQTVAIVGPTGAGKTTIVNLLMRFYELDSGRILLDGIDIASMPREKVRRNFGMVLQDTWLFGGTIRENIAYGNTEATEAEIVQAAVDAHADRFIRTLPDGYDTVIEDDANNISVGERQLLTIARAFLADPAVLILDEATSNVDTRTEALIQSAMHNLRLGRTGFVIAHRLSTIRNADRIIVMRDGGIVEQGTHDELIATKGEYSNLYRSQFEID
jgi:ATP-binding cassette subfamily B protein